jgi:lysophospholipase L1-like esterase
MRVLLILVVILLIIGVYLNRAYAHFYDSIGNTILPKTTSEVYSLGKGDNYLKVAIMGDSLSAGVGASQGEKSYPYLFARRWADRGFRVTLYNFASPAAETKDVLNSQLSGAINKNPDIVLILIGINDIHNQVSELYFTKNYRDTIVTLKSKTRGKIYLVSVPYLGSGKILFFPYNMLLTVKTGSYNQIIKSLARENDVTYIDLYSATKTKFESDDSLYSEDNFHPSDEGYLLWEEVINANFNQ